MSSPPVPDRKGRPPEWLLQGMPFAKRIPTAHAPPHAHRDAKGAHPLWSKSKECGTQSRSVSYCAGYRPSAKRPHPFARGAKGWATQSPFRNLRLRHPPGKEEGTELCSETSCLPHVSNVGDNGTLRIINNAAAQRERENVFVIKWRLRMNVAHSVGATSSRSGRRLTAVCPCSREER